VRSERGINNNNNNIITDNSPLKWSRAGKPEAKRREAEEEVATDTVRNLISRPHVKYLDEGYIYVIVYFAVKVSYCMCIYIL
jgi:hypothetical protein